MEQPEYNFLNRNKPKRMIICKRCGKEKLHSAKGLCGLCYTNVRDKKRAKVKRLFF